MKYVRVRVVVHTLIHVVPEVPSYTCTRMILCVVVYSRKYFRTCTRSVHVHVTSGSTCTFVRKYFRNKVYNVLYFRKYNVVRKYFRKYESTTQGLLAWPTFIYLKVVTHLRYSTSEKASTR